MTLSTRRKEDKPDDSDIGLKPPQGFDRRSSRPASSAQRKSQDEQAAQDLSTPSFSPSFLTHFTHPTQLTYSEHNNYKRQHSSNTPINKLSLRISQFILPLANLFITQFAIHLHFAPCLYLQSLYFQCVLHLHSCNLLCLHALHLLIADLPLCIPFSGMYEFYLHFSISLPSVG